MDTLFQQAVNTKSNNQVVLTLPAEDFFIRGRFGAFPTSHPGLTTADSVTIQGAVNPNGVKQTRIIAGIPAPEAFWGNVRRPGQAPTNRDLPADDPWNLWLADSEIASGREIYWIDLDHFATAADDGPGSPLTYSGTRAWETDRSKVWFWRFLRDKLTPEDIPSPITATSFSGNSYQSLMTMTMNGIPMRMAELADVCNTTIDGKVVPDYSGTGYTRTLPSNSQTMLRLNANSTFFDETKYYPLPLNFNMFGTNDLLCTVFHGNDYQPVTVPVSTIEGLYTEWPPNVFGIAEYEIWLNLNPFSSDVPKKDNSIIDFTKGQRFKLLNSPQFLRRPGTFILRTTGPSEKWNKMIFFIPAEDESDEEYAIRQVESSGALPAGPRPPGSLPPVGSRRLEISCPKYETGASSGVIFSDTLSLGARQIGSSGNYSFESLAGITVKNLIFSTGVGTGARIANVPNVTVQGNYFRNFGNSNLTLIATPNLMVGGELESLGNIFRGGYKGMVTLAPYQWRFNPNVPDGIKTLDRTDFKISPPRGFPPSSAIPSHVSTLTGPGILVGHNLFERTGTHFPEIAALQADGYLINAQIQDNKFEQVAGAAINMGGIKNTIQRNTFKDCVMHQTDAGAIYFARSFAQVGNRIENNDFWNIRNRTPYPNPFAKPDLTDEVNGVMLDDTFFGAVVKDNRFHFVPATMFWDHKRGIKSNGGAFCVFKNNADSDNKYSVALHKINVDNLSNIDPVKRYQHYRELGEFLKSSELMVAGNVNTAWETMLAGLAFDSTGINTSGPLKQRSFGLLEVRKWFEELAVSTAYSAPIWPQTTPATPWAELAAAPAGVNPPGNPFFSVVGGVNKIQNLHMVCDTDVER